MSATSPGPSVLSPSTSSPSKASVLTAPAASARGVCRRAKAKASGLKGSVTFRPAPPSARNASTAATKPSGGASRRPYSIASPVCAANSAWISGERLCAIGLPITA